MARSLIPSIKYKDEDKLLDGAEDVDKTYVEQVLPGKMKYNLQALEKFGFWRDIGIMFMTVFAVLGKDYSEKETEEEKTKKKTEEGDLKDGE